MFPSKPSFCLFLVFVSISIQFTSSYPLSTIAISYKSANQTLVCALIPSPKDKRATLNCTNLRDRSIHQYPSSKVPYLAITAGDGFLCALSAHVSSNATIQLWNFTQAGGKAKRVYRGSPLEALAASGYHVCGIISTSHEPKCWRWHRFALPAGLSFSAIAVGEDFLCGISHNKEIKCYGRSLEIVDKKPSGSFDMLAAGRRHACGVASNGTLVCWGASAPAPDAVISVIASLALGDNQTCALASNGTVRCWGVNCALPRDLAESQFLAIETKGDVFCGVLAHNYSLVCWGSEEVRRNPVVFDRVLPGVCVASCPCSILPGSGNICFSGFICQPCMQRRSTVSTAPPPAQRSGRTSKKKRAFIIAGCVGLGVSLVAAMCVLFWFRRNSSRIHEMRPPTPTDQLKNHHSCHVQEFSLEALLAITNNFSESHKIGSGSFGSVYCAVLGDGREVAIKRAMVTKKRRDKDQAFRAELALLSRINHKNVVRLLGFCDEGIERLLVYEFMAGGTLQDHLHTFPSSPLDSWAERIRVALDAARGIEYLHMYAVPPVFHRDIKPSNILLDAVFTAKVSDFGLSLAGLDEDTAQLCAAAGTLGYMDPEYYRLQHLTDKSDVYSFGVVLLELLTGCKAIHRNEETGSPRNLVNLAVPSIQAVNIQSVLDVNLPPLAPGELQAVALLGQMAVCCVSMDSAHRPTMSEVVGSLQRAVAICSVPLLDTTQDGVCI